MAGSHSSLKSVSVVSICSFAQLIFQFAFQLLLAKYFGASAEMDAYVAAMALPTVVSTILVGSLGYAFVPTFIACRQNVGDDEAWSMASNFGLLLFFFAIVLSAIGTSAARPLMAALHPGFAPQQQEQTAQLFRILSWLILSNSLMSLLQAVHHSHQRFAVPALAAVVGTVVTVLCAMMFYQFLGISAAATAVLSGSLVAVCIQLPLFVRHFRCRFRVDAGTKKCLRLLLPLLLGAAYYNLDPLVDRYLASRMPTGSISHLGYAWRLTNALLLVSTSGLSIVAFPTFARQSAAGRNRELHAEIAYALRFLCFLVVPIVIGVLCCGEAVIHDLFQRGKFTASDTHAVSVLLALYTGVIVGGSFGGIAAKVFYALGDTRTPVIIGVGGFTIGIGLKFLLVPSHGVVALASATSFYVLLNAIAMLTLIGRKSGKGAFDGFRRSLFRYGFGSAIAAAVGLVVIRADFRFASFVAAASGLVVYGAVLLLLHDEFAVKFRRFVADYLSRVFGSGSAKVR